MDTLTIRNGRDAQAFLAALDTDVRVDILLGDEGNPDRSPFLNDMRLLQIAEFPGPGNRNLVINTVELMSNIDAYLAKVSIPPVEHLRSSRSAVGERLTTLGRSLRSSLPFFS